MTVVLPRARWGVRRRRRLGVFSVAAIVGVSVLTACTSGGTGSSSAQSDTLVIANPVKVDTLDPQVSSVNESIWLDQTLYSRLVQPDPTGTKIVPDLATSWTTSPDGLTYTFKLRDAKFSDGSPVTASDVAYSINRAKSYKGGWGFLITSFSSIPAPHPSTAAGTLSN